MNEADHGGGTRALEQRVRKLRRELLRATENREECEGDLADARHREGLARQALDDAVADLAAARGGTREVAAAEPEPDDDPPGTIH